MREQQLVSWNVNGIRAAIKKGFWEWLATSQPDVVCLQETKISPEQITHEMKTPTHAGGTYHTYWSCAEKKGYSGVAIFSKEKPISVTEGLGVPGYDTEGRTLIAEFSDFVLSNIYYPNGQRGDDRLQYKLAFYDHFLDKMETLRQQGKKIVMCGDYNTAHHAIDLARPKENEGTSGFLPIERAWMDKYVAHGYVDTFRLLYPEEQGAYSWWNMRSAARERNVGWRIDYFFVTPDLAPQVANAAIHPEVMGSDHCPVSVTLSF